MADAAVEIQFTSAGVEHTQKRIIALQGQLRSLSATIEKMPKIDLGGGGAGGDVGFKREVWREFHNIFAGIEEELDRVVQAVNKLNESMAKSASGGTRANTEAIKAQTAAMKDLSNTNAMLHEVLIGEAPLNVEIKKTRKAVAVASKETATQTEKVAKASKRAAQSVRGFGAFSKETATVLANSLAPGLGLVVNQINAAVSALRMALATPVGIAIAAITAAVAGLYFWFKKLSDMRFEAFQKSLEQMTLRVQNLKQEAQIAAGIFSGNKEAISDAPFFGDNQNARELSYKEASNRAEQSAKKAVEAQEKIFENERKRAVLSAELAEVETKMGDALDYEDKYKELKKQATELRSEIRALAEDEKTLANQKRLYERNALSWTRLASDAQVRENAKEAVESSKKKDENEKLSEDVKNAIKEWQSAFKISTNKSVKDWEEQIRRREAVFSGGYQSGGNSLARTGLMRSSPAARAIEITAKKSEEIAANTDEIVRQINLSRPAVAG